jgi:hypothetical protein
MADQWLADGEAKGWSTRWVMLAAAYLLPIWPTASQLLFVQPMVICLTWLLLESASRVSWPGEQPLGFVRLVWHGDRRSAAGEHD